MNASLPPTPPDDEAPDALLAALQQRLSNYGQAPPPAAWAAIRRRVAPPPLPWWRRPRRLLPLLALLGGLLLLGTPTGQVGWHWLAEPPASTNPKVSPSTTSSPTTHSTSRPYSSPEINHPPATAAAPTANLESVFSRQLATLHQSGKTVSTPMHPAKPLAWAVAPAANNSAKRPYHAGTTGRKPTLLSGRVSVASYSLRNTAGPTTRRAASGQVAVSPVTASPAATAAAQPYQPTTRSAAQLALTKTQSITVGQVAAAKATTTRRLASASPTHSLAAYSRSQSSRRLRRPVSATRLPATLAVGVPTIALAAPTRAPAAVASQLPAAPLPGAEQRTPLGLLALTQPSLLLPESALAPALTARPDSTPPSALARRWSVLVLAGPTLSYRTLGPAPTLAAGHPDFARLERPALGLGAQVQVRRVLSGRWALAVGVGYHEYATRLALRKDSLPIHQRDTYRLLTVPVQVTYALSAPRGRLATGLLLGAEPGWYLGGRSTEGSGCGCEQQVYSAAASSPYRSLSVAFSLGLDVRYRLGGAASRWQWLVQPTGRYVATPFVRSEATGFTQRQPFSLGLFTGFSWDVR